MIVTTTNSIEDRRISAYHGVVVGEAIMGANVVRDLFAGITDIIGGRASSYEAKLAWARAQMACAKSAARATHFASPEAGKGRRDDTAMGAGKVTRADATSDAPSSAGRSSAR